MNKQLIKAGLLVLAVSGFFTVFTSQAEVTKIPLSMQGSPEIRAKLPKSGELKTKVEQRLGSPIAIRGPLGNPPITTWTYSDFTVYFEYDHVIHSVVNLKKR